ncbi:MAG: hypothetical protein JXA23_12655, partial [Bacteroidales bacterium]|nr:hypothetical protein [Bacteroidales bacterium]
MKQFAFLFSTLVIAGSLFTSSCKKDDNNDEPVPLVFTFTLQNGQGYVSGDAVLSTGEQFKVGIRSNAATGSTLSRLFITRSYNDKPDQVLDSTLQSDQFSFDYSNISILVPGQEIWDFTIWQNNGDSITQSFVITTESVVGPIFTYDQVIIGAQINSIGKFCSTSDASILDLPTAKANSGKIDLVYLFSQETFATLASPDDEIAAQTYVDGGTFENPGPNAILNWPIRNATRFRVITDPIDWNAIVDDSM